MVRLADLRLVVLRARKHCENNSDDGEKNHHSYKCSRQETLHVSPKKIRESDDG